MEKVPQVRVDLADPLEGGVDVEIGSMY